MLYFYVESAKYSAYTDKRTLHSIRCRVHRGQVHRVRLLSQLQAQGQSRRLLAREVTSNSHWDGDILNKTRATPSPSTSPWRPTKWHASTSLPSSSSHPTCSATRLSLERSVCTSATGIERSPYRHKVSSAQRLDTSSETGQCSHPVLSISHPVYSAAGLSPVDSLFTSATGIERSPYWQEESSVRSLIRSSKTGRSPPSLSSQNHLTSTQE